MNDILKGGYAIDDQLTKSFINTLLYKTDIDDFSSHNGMTDLHNSFPEKMREWVASSELNKIEGLTHFKHSSVTNGTSEAFIMFFLRYMNFVDRFVFFKGDFIMHKVASNVSGLNWDWIESADEIDKGDALIVSCPFSDFGQEHPEMSQALDVCDMLDIPVLIDMAYFGMCDNLQIDLNRKCIKDVTFSLGKTFPIINFRAGVRFTKDEIDDPVVFANQHGIVNTFGAYVGSKLVEHFTPDYISSKYRSIANIVCDRLKVAPTKCVIFGSSDLQEHKELNRGNTFTRVCLSTLIREEYDKSNGT